ncbi:hypothetical protein ACFX13_027794 [Malus domestica]
MIEMAWGLELSQQRFIWVVRPPSKSADAVFLHFRSKVLPLKTVVGREEIEEMMRKIMVDKNGQAIRGRVKELKLNAAKGLSVGCSSYNALSQISSGNQIKC